MRPLRLVLLGVLLMLFATPAAAQKQVNTLSAVIELSNGYTVVLPDGWELDSFNDDIAVFVSDDSTIMLFDPAVVADLLDGDNVTDPVDALISTYDAFYDDRLDDDEIDSDDFAGFDAAHWEFSEGSRRDGVFILAQLDDEVFVAFDIVTPAGEVDEASDAAAEMLSSLRGDGVGLAANPVEEDEPVTVAVSDEPCVVSTDSADTVRLRVGPGVNRTSVAFLPAGVEVDVIGRFTADDGSEWFRLDKDQAAPQSAANEIWVLRDDVDESGGCNAVVDAAAPPVVPITNAPPPAPPASSDAPAGDETTTTTISGDGLPLAGTWTINFARQSNVSCQGYQNVVINTVETWDSWLESDFVWRGFLSLQGSNIVFDGDVYRLNGVNSYVGSFDRLDGLSNQIYLNFNSPTTVSGQLTGNFIYEGIPCSASTSFSGSRG